MFLISPPCPYGYGFVVVVSVFKYFSDGGGVYF